MKDLLTGSLMYKGKGLTQPKYQSIILVSIVGRGYVNLDDMWPGNVYRMSIWPVDTY